MQLAREELEQAYRQMKTIRDFEDHLHREIAKGTIGGFTHLYGGQEAIAVGVCENLRDTDYITSTHRGHGHCIAKGCDVKGMMKELYGRADGLCIYLVYMFMKIIGIQSTQVHPMLLLQRVLQAV